MPVYAPLRVRPADASRPPPVRIPGGSARPMETPVQQRARDERHAEVHPDRRSVHCVGVVYGAHLIAETSNPRPPGPHSHAPTVATLPCYSRCALLRGVCRTPGSCDILCTNVSNTPLICIVWGHQKPFEPTCLTDPDALRRSGVLSDSIILTCLWGL
jgi:hypothetical protein